MTRMDPQFRPRSPIAVYTAIAGGYDSLKPLPDSWHEAADCIAYLDQPISSRWDVRDIKAGHHDPCRRAKAYKMLPDDLFAAYEYSIWIDGSIVPKAAMNPREVVHQTLARHDLAVFRHRRRRCIYAEAKACIAAGKDDPAVIERQVARYRSLGYPEGNGLHECTVLVRRHTPAVKRLCAEWAHEIQQGSRRDQISFDYVVHRQRFPVFDLPGTVIDNPYFLWVYHDAGSGSLVPVVEVPDAAPA